MKKKILNSIIKKDKRKYLKAYLVNVWIELKNVFSCIVRFSVGPVHCSRDLQVLYSTKKKKIKTRSHGTIHAFKNYFVTVFLVFNFQFSVSVKISCIQTDPKYGYIQPTIARMDK